MDTDRSTWRREVAIGAALLAFGLFLLPAAIYVVGQQIFGEYSPDGSVFALAEQLWADLLSLQPLAWLLVLSPYILVQLIRGIRRVWRRTAV